MTDALPTAGQFALNPHWDNWMVVLYFFLGGVAAGAYFTAAMAQLLDKQRLAGFINTAHLLAFPLVLVCAALLTLDLGRPERFWHMVLQSETWLPMFKWWSPMSVGAVALLMFGAFTFASFLNALYTRGWRLPFGSFMHGLHEGRVGTVFNLIGSAVGFFIASYTGVLLDVSNQPVWTDQWFLGALFLASAASTGVAAVILLTPRSRENLAYLREIEAFDDWAMVLELVLIVAFFIALGALARPVLASPYGIVLLVGVAGLGLIVPLLLHRFGRGRRALLVVAPLLALVGGLLLRVVVVMMPRIG